MPVCLKCGKKIKTDLNFCTSCGAPQNEEESNKRRIVYEGELRKCPNCGGIINSFEIRCEMCGHEIRGSKGSSVVSEFAQKLEDLEKNRRDDKPIRGFLGLYLSLFEVSLGKINSVDKAKASLIRNFVIPNTKEDILEFMILANSNIDSNVIGGMSNDYGYNELFSQKAIMNAWKTKMEQAYQKAKISFGNDPEFQKIEKIYKQKKDEIQKKKNKKIIMFLILPVVYVLIIALLIEWSSSGFGSKDRREEKLEAIVEEIEEDMYNGDYDAALFKANNLYYDGTRNTSKAKQWDERRQSIIEMIKNKETESDNKNFLDLLNDSVSNIFFSANEKEQIVYVIEGVFVILRIISLY